MKSIIFISHLAELDRVSTISLHNRRFAQGIRILHVDLHALPWGYTQILRKLLAAANRITDLILDLPPHSHIILNNLCQGRLVLFRATFPHRVLLDFLRRHPSIKYLQLGSCQVKRKFACPLIGVTLPHLEDLTCPPACTFLGNPATLRITATYRGAQDIRIPAYKILQSATSGTHLTVLHIDFDPTDFGLLRCIAGGAPSLTALKLTEENHMKMVCYSLPLSTTEGPYMHTSDSTECPRVENGTTINNGPWIFDRSLVSLSFSSERKAPWFTFQAIMDRRRC